MRGPRSGATGTKAWPQKIQLEKHKTTKYTNNRGGRVFRRCAPCANHHRPAGPQRQDRPKSTKGEDLYGEDTRNTTVRSAERCEASGLLLLDLASCGMYALLVYSTSRNDLTKDHIFRTRIPAPWWKVDAWLPICPGVCIQAMPFPNKDRVDHHPLRREDPQNNRYHNRGKQEANKYLKSIQITRMADGKDQKPYDGPSSAQFYPDSDGEHRVGDSDADGDSDTELENPAPAAGPNDSAPTGLGNSDPGPGVQQPDPDAHGSTVRRRSRRISINSSSDSILTRSRAKRTRKLSDHLSPPLSCKRAARCLDDFLSGP